MLGPGRAAGGFNCHGCPGPATGGFGLSQLSSSHRSCELQALSAGAQVVAAGYHSRSNNPKPMGWGTKNPPPRQGLVRGPCCFLRYDCSDRSWLQLKLHARHLKVGKAAVFLFFRLLGWVCSDRLWSMPLTKVNLSTAKAHSGVAVLLCVARWQNVVPPLCADCQIMLIA